MKHRDFKLAVSVPAMLAGLLLSGGAVFAAQPPAEAEDELAATEAEAVDETARPECVRVTGSRLCRDAETIEGDGRTPNTAENVTVYSRKDLETTGQSTTADALRQLDPRLR